MDLLFKLINKSFQITENIINKSPLESLIFQSVEMLSPKNVKLLPYAL